MINKLIQQITKLITKMQKNNGIYEGFKGKNLELF